MKLIKLTDANDRIHYININYIVDVHDRGDLRFVITTNKEVFTTELVDEILQKIVEAEK